ncbi:MAG: ABC transporter permease [Acidimicrobiales bacterium]
MWTAELGLLFRRRRTVALLGVLALLPVVTGLALRFTGGGSGGPAFLSQVTNNGVFLAVAGLTVVSQFFLPLTVAIVAGDTVAGDASLGTLRYILARPVGRTRFLAAKLVATLCFCVVAALVVAITGLIVGAILFSVGPVTTLSGFQVSLLAGVGRSLLAALVVGMSMFGLAAVGLFISTLTEAPVGAMAATAGIFIACLIAEGIPQLNGLQPFLLTNHWTSFADLFRVPVYWGSVLSDLALQAAWGAVCCLAAWSRFTTADVLA